MSTALAVRLPNALAERLDDAVKTSRRSKAAYVIEGLEQVLAREEWERGVLKAADDYWAGRLETFSADEIRKSLGLDD